MTAKQRAARAKFKAVVAEAKKLRKKNPKLTQAQAVKQAFAISYSKKRAGVGAVKKKAAPKKKAATKVKAKKSRSTEMHTDTKSHNVNIRVISGTESNMYKIRDQYEQDIKSYLNTIYYLKKVSKTTLTKEEKIKVAKALKSYKNLYMVTKKLLNQQNQLINKALK